MAVPTDLEQYVLELVNRARSDPATEADRLGIDLNDGLSPGTISPDPKQPLATNTLLTEAARDHSQWMLNEDVFSHTGAGGSSPGDRMASAGYVFNPPWGWGENIAWKGTTGPLGDSLRTEFVADMHDNLVISPGHRTNIMLPSFREVGIGEAAGVFTSDGSSYNSTMLTENFAYSGSAYFLTGVIFDDLDGDDFYSPGEGRGAVAISIAGGGTTSWSSGGYSVAYSGSGWQTVTLSGGGLDSTKTLLAEFGGQNVKIDLIDGDTVQSSTGVELLGGLLNVVHLGLYGGTSTGDDNSNGMTGGGGVDVFEGGGGSDTILANAGNDTLRGGAGADTLDGGAGTDRLYGGADADHLVFAPGMGLDVVYDFEDGIDLIEVVGLEAAEISILAYGATDTEIRGSGGERMVLRNVDPSQIDGDDFIGVTFGGPLTGTEGPDTLEGTPGDDEISGLGGNDWLYGYDGADTLDGGAGTDRLYGGAGADHLVFAPGMGLDVVYDFEDGIDKIEVVGLEASDVSIVAYGATDTEIHTMNGERMVLRDIDPSMISLEGDFMFA